MAKYSLVGVDGNAYSVMGYTAKALKREGLGNLVDEMYEKATEGNYNHLLCVCMDYVDMANDKAYENGYEDLDDYDLEYDD